MIPFLFQPKIEKNHVARSHRLTVRKSQWLLMRRYSWVKPWCVSGNYCMLSQMSYNDKELVLEEH